jgi:sugar/nucleoside kinase (ribokinase family)
LVVEEGEETGVSVILVAAEGGRSVVTYRGASKMLTYKDIPWKKLKTKWLYVSSLGGRIALLEELCRFAKKQKIKLAVNPGGREIVHKERVLKCVEGAEALILNQEEAEKLTGTNYTDMRVFKSKECVLGPKIGIITAGKLGGKVCAEGKCIYYRSSKVKKVSSLGAGDAFGSGFVAALIHAKNLEVAVEWGKRNAESVLRFLSAKKGLLRFSEIIS